jgi:hypothetical protein
MTSPKCLSSSSFLVHCFIVFSEISSHASTVFQWNWCKHYWWDLWKTVNGSR